MTLHADLLEQATYLSTRERTRPKQASLRRAVSTAYYSVFHLLNHDASLLLGSNLSPARRASIQRWFDHRETKRVCQTFLKSDFPKPKSLSGLTVSPHLQTVARNFLRLQEARLQADYDLAATWTRLRAEQQVTLARDTFVAWNIIRDSEEANVFILSLLLLDKWDRERQ